MLADIRIMCSLSTYAMGRYNEIELNAKIVFESMVMMNYGH